MRGSIVFAIAIFLFHLDSVCLFAQEVAAPAKKIRFARDVRPILSEHCFRCHGPDSQQRKGELRLDREGDAKRQQDGQAAVTPHKLDQSELWLRITSTSEDERMPPPDSGQKLTSTQVEVIRQWIEQGAAWEQHWSFVPPVQNALPKIKNGSWSKNPIDAFVASRLEAEGLQPSRPADKETLIRRVTLDLTGLPPTLDEIDDFLADDAPNAYEKVVERLLASPRYGERMAWMWLEAARYADTSGYQNDGPRSMWRWRDWVIEAFNSGMPFDQFTVEQLAGDLLPGATLDQQIATGFNRNHRGNSEGGIIPEEYQVEYVVDRVDTTATVWLGLTMGCARCHDHKYDPITQRDFYRVFAYFNNISENGRAIKEGNSPPYIAAPTREQQRKLAQLDAQLAAAEGRWKQLDNSLVIAQQTWEESPVGRKSYDDEMLLDGCSARFSFEPIVKHDDLFSEWKLSGGDARTVPGRLGETVNLGGKDFIDGGDVGNFGYLDKFSAAFWVKPSSTKSGTLISRMTDEEQGDGWYIQLRDGHVQVNLIKRWLDDALRVESEPTIEADRWTHLAMTYDGSRQARGVTLFVDGKPVSLVTKLDQLNQTITVKEPLRIGGGNGPAGRFTGLVDELHLFGRQLTGEEVLQLATPETIAEILAISRDKRTEGQRLKLQSCFLATAASQEYRDAWQRLKTLRDQQQKFVESLPTVMIMQELESTRPTHVLVRGEYNRPGEAVSPGVPASLAPLEKNSPGNRLGFAQWLISPSNPLTARVAVNRLWQLHFGSGLVRTTEDFGMQGEPPADLALLDWLAVEFRGPSESAGSESAGRRAEPVRTWDLKWIQRQIVTSATYRQSSALPAGGLSPAKSSASTAAGEKDHVLDRSPRFRLSAEMLRDQALAVSGLFSEQSGGPSVKTYQPADLWKDLATDSVYDQDHGAKLYRRSLYIYWKRTVAPPSMTAFDAAGREACEVRTPRTNTPLQALTLLNEITFVEAARNLAQNVLLEANMSAANRLKKAFRQTTGRLPSESELALLMQNLQRNLAYFRSSPEKARRLIEIGESPRPQQLDVAELAAYTMVANLLLNLDEVVTRQ